MPLEGSHEQLTWHLLLGMWEQLVKRHGLLGGRAQQLQEDRIFGWREREIILNRFRGIKYQNQMVLLYIQNLIVAIGRVLKRISG
jgi:hypothetical protein